MKPEFSPCEYWKRRKSRNWAIIPSKNFFRPTFLLLFMLGVYSAAAPAQKTRAPHRNDALLTQVIRNRSITSRSRKFHAL
ncbi:unnamed protein product [Caenorhabditis sp. 36 PRJEB53466]|nr:unnamed protein product [Caenorhabditis sp. 36 PRJEB53466]